MRISPRILTTALLAFCAFAFAGAQSTNDLPKLSEIKGKKLLEKITPLKHKRGMWGYANNEAKFIIKPVFNEACPFEGKVARVKIADKWGTIGSNGLFIVEPLYYERIDPYSSDSLSIAVSAGKFGLINAKGARVQKIMYELIDYADYGYRAKIDGKYCTIDSKGEIILDPRFDQMEMLDRRRGLEQVYMKGKWGVLKDGKDLLTLAFDEKITKAKAMLAGAERDQLLYEAEETLFGEGGFPVCPVYYYTNMYCSKGLTNLGYTTMGYFFFMYAKPAA